jgi:hypothetical protein
MASVIMAHRGIYYGVICNNVVFIFPHTHTVQHLDIIKDFLFTN